jgi:exonuclease III
VKFEVDSNGRERRRHNPGLLSKYPGGTQIEKVNFSFSISKSHNGVVKTANVIQFPIKLAFACTAHKIQGATIHKPMKLIISVMDIWNSGSAIVYVMLSRICALWQLYILEEFKRSKMFPSKLAIKELERLEEISKNRNPTEWEIEDKGTLKISSTNCRSLRKHYQDIISDSLLSKSDVICLQETWLEDNIEASDLEIENYQLHLNSYGKGKGIAIYFKVGTVRHETDIKEENFQLTKFTSELMDLVVIYRSQSGNHKHLTQILEKLIDKEKPLMVLGDFNFCFLDSSMNCTKQFFNKHSFSQLVHEPTHIEGNLLDQALVRDTKKINKYTIELHSKYYTDHKGLAVVIKR